MLNTGVSPNTVTVIDGSTDTVVGSPIAVGAGNIFSRIAVDPHDDKVYVSNAGTTTVSVIDAAHGNAVDPVTFRFTNGGAAKAPRKILVDPATDDVYVMGTSTGSNGVMIIAGDDSTSWIDLSNSTPADCASCSQPNSGVTGFALNDRTDTVYAEVGFGTDIGLVAIDDGHPSHAIARTQLSVGGTQVLSINGAFAVNSAADKIYEIGAGPQIPRPLDPSNFYSPAWTMVTDGTSLTTTKVAEIDTSPVWTKGIAVNVTTNAVFDVGQNLASPTPTGVIGRFDGTTGTYTGRVPSGTQSTGVLPDRAIAVNPNTNRVYYAAQLAAGDANEQGGLQAFDGTTLLSQTIDGDRARAFVAIAVNPTTNKVYATDPTGSVAVLR